MLSKLNTGGAPKHSKTAHCSFEMCKDLGAIAESKGAAVAIVKHLIQVVRMFLKFLASIRFGPEIAPTKAYGHGWLCWHLAFMNANPCHEEPPQVN